MDALMLDGNAVAGLLQEVFAVEMTTARCTCDACGVTNQVGALHVFQGAGVVMRCPDCNEVLVTIVKDGSHIRIGLRASGCCRSPSSFRRAGRRQSARRLC